MRNLAYDMAPHADDDEKDSLTGRVVEAQSHLEVPLPSLAESLQRASMVGHQGSWVPLGPMVPL